MRQAVLGAGGVGGFLAVIMADAGHDVTLVLRPASLAAHPDHVILERPGGAHRAAVTRTSALRGDVDLLWVTTKATQLEAALAEVPEPERVAAVVPLLNGVDHVERLRAYFPPDRVVPGTMVGELERLAPGRIAQRTPVLRFTFAEAGRAALGPAADALVRAGCECAFAADERAMLWRKLAGLAAFALTTSASGLAMGELRASQAWHARLAAVIGEACAVAAALGVTLDPEVTLRALESLPPGTRSSMMKDLAAGRPPELDAIAGPILREGARLGVAVPETARLAREVQERAAAT